MDNAAVLNTDNPVRQLGDFLVVGNHHNGLSKFPAGHLQKAENILAGFAVQVAGGLIRQDNGRGRRQRPGNGNPLLLPAGELIGQGIQLFLQSQGLHNPLYKFRIHFPAVQLNGQDNVLVHIQHRDQIVRLKDKANGDEIAEAMLDGIDMHKWVCVAADKASVATFDDKVLFVMADSELVDVDALMTDAANALGVTFGYNMSKESAEDYGELPDELLATPAVVG